MIRDKKEKENHSKTSADKQQKERKNIKCRVCFIVDGYTASEKKCKHCGSQLFEIDRY